VTRHCEERSDEANKNGSPHGADCRFPKPKKRTLAVDAALAATTLAAAAMLTAATLAALPRLILAALLLSGLVLSALLLLAGLALAALLRIALLVLRIALFVCHRDVLRCYRGLELASRRSPAIGINATEAPPFPEACCAKREQGLVTQ
jgi:hypothetical protein